jgi:hypothetical protein
LPIGTPFLLGYSITAGSFAVVDWVDAVAGVAIDEPIKATPEKNLPRRSEEFEPLLSDDFI